MGGKIPAGRRSQVSAVAHSLQGEDPQVTYLGSGYAGWRKEEEKLVNSEV